MDGLSQATENGVPRGLLFQGQARAGRRGGGLPCLRLRCACSAATETLGQVGRSQLPPPGERTYWTQVPAAWRDGSTAPAGDSLSQGGRPRRECKTSRLPAPSNAGGAGTGTCLARAGAFRSPPAPFPRLLSRGAGYLMSGLERGTAGG